MAFLRPPSDRTQAARVFLISVGITAAFGMITARFAVQPSSLELVGTETGLCNVWLLRKQHVLAWPFGIASVIAADRREAPLPGSV